MTTNGNNKRLIEELKDKAYREAFVASQIDNGVAFQIRVMRKKKEWTQKELGDKSGMKQTRIHVLEDPNKINVNISTLRRLASAFDVALMVKFVPFSDLVKWDNELSPESLQVASFSEDIFFAEKANIDLPIGAIKEAYESNENNVISIQDYLEKHPEKNSELGASLSSKGQGVNSPKGTPSVLSQQTMQGRQW